jgi:hypothetical protein
MRLMPFSATNRNAGRKLSGMGHDWVTDLDESCGIVETGKQ